MIELYYKGEKIVSVNAVPFNRISASWFMDVEEGKTYYPFYTLMTDKGVQHLNALAADFRVVRPSQVKKRIVFK